MQHETKKPIILHQRYMVNRLWRRFNSNTLCNRGLETNQTKTNSDIHDWCDQCCMRCLLAAVGIPWDSGVGVFFFRTWGLPGQFWSNKNDSVEPMNRDEHSRHRPSQAAQNAAACRSAPEAAGGRRPEAGGRSWKMSEAKMQRIVQ